MSDPAKIAQAQSIHDGFTRYVDQFTKVVEGRRVIGFTSKDGLRGQLRKAVHEVEVEIKNMNLPMLEAALLSMHRSEKDFFLRLDAKYVGKLEKGMAHYLAVVAEYVEDEDDQEYLSDMAEIYFAGFKKVSSSLLSEKVDRKTLSSIFAEIEPQLTELQTDANAEFDLAKSHLADDATTTFMVLIAAMVISAALAAALGFLIVRMLSAPLVSMTSSMVELASGNLDVEAPARDFANEVGEMAEAVETFKQNAIAALKLSEEAAHEQTARETRARQIETLCNDFDKSITLALNNVSTSSTQMENTAQNMATVAGTAGERSQAVAAASEQASGNVQTVAAASEELSASIQEISSQVTSSADIAQSAVGAAEEATEQVQGLVAASQKIGDVVGLINDIASQTNLLALNATIEAARAGDAG